MRKYWAEEDGASYLEWMATVCLLVLIGMALWSLWNSLPPNWVVANDQFV